MKEGYAPEGSRLAIDAVLEAYRAGSTTPLTVAARVHERILVELEQDATWIAAMPWPRIREQIEALPRDPRALPLHGVPFAVKDNIDVEGLDTTAACPGFARTARRTAPVVERLMRAGAILVGKTNMDQFATGLVGTRSPYGACSSVFSSEHVSGGSSSGSAVAVAEGTVSFALGTDTAGSGRVPAAFNGIVGVKPTRGLLSTTGVVPACRSLDCVSVFASSVADARRVLAVAAGYDDEDPYSRAAPARSAPAPTAPPRTAPSRPARPPRLRLAVPRSDQLEFFGDAESARLWRAALDRAGELAELVRVDLAPFREGGDLLYGPWVAERYAAFGSFVRRHRGDVDPTVRRIVLGARRHSSVDVFRAQHRLAELQRRIEPLWDEADALLLPTTPTVATHAEVAAQPVEVNARLGIYTTFANLFDLCAVAVPAGLRRDGMPFGVSLLAPGFDDAALLDVAVRWAGEPETSPPPHLAVLPAPVAPVPPALPASTAASSADASEALAAAPADPPSLMVELAVVGAHLSGMPLNSRLLELGAELVETTRTAADYRCYALPGGPPARPGLVRDPSHHGPGIEAEVWRMSPAALGALTAETAPPLGIGSVTLADGRTVRGFICEIHATREALEITALGGWRAYRTQTPDATRS